MYACENCSKEFDNMIDFANHVIKCENERKAKEAEEREKELIQQRENKRLEIESEYQAVSEKINKYIEEYGSLEIKNCDNSMLIFSSNYFKRPIWYPFI